MLQKFLRRPAVTEVTGLPRSSIYDAIAAGTFPKPFPLGEKAVGWLEAEIIEWQQKRIAEPRGSRLPCSGKLKRSKTRKAA